MQSMHTGPERPIVLLHGCGGSFAAAFETTGWLDAIRAAGRSAVRIHLPGHGVIPAPHDPAHYADLAGLVMKELPDGALRCSRFLAGCEAAARDRDAHSRSVLVRMVLGGVGDNVFAPEGVAEAAARALEFGPERGHSAAGAGVPENVGAAAKRSARGRSRSAPPAEPRLHPGTPRAVTQPVLIVNGAEDPVARQSSRLLDSLAAVTSPDVPGVGHFGLPAQPAFIRPGHRLPAGAHHVMKLASFHADGRDRIGRRVFRGRARRIADVLRAAGSIAHAAGGHAGAHPRWRCRCSNELRAALVTRTLHAYSSSSTEAVSWHPPVRTPSKIVCLALNNRALDAIKIRAPTDHPAFFLKPFTALTGPPHVHQAARIVRPHASRARARRRHRPNPEGRASRKHDGCRVRLQRSSTTSPRWACARKTPSRVRYFKPGKAPGEVTPVKGTRVIPGDTRRATHSRPWAPGW